MRRCHSRRVADREVDFRPGISVLVQRDLGGEAGAGQGAGSHRDIVQFHVVRGAREAHTVCTGMWRARSALIASAPMPPVLSPPSLSSTTAPMGKSEVSALGCLRAVAEAGGGRARLRQRGYRYARVRRRRGTNAFERSC